MTLDDWFLPFRRRQVLVAAITSLDTVSRAVFCNSLSVMWTVGFLTRANTLSIGLNVYRCSHRSAGHSLICLSGGLDADQRRRMLNNLGLPLISRPH